MPNIHPGEATRPNLKITALKAVQINSCTQSILKVETDAGITGYAEAGGPGPMIRGNLAYFERWLIGQNPLDIEKHYNTLVHLQHPDRAHIPTVSGIDCALWDIAGKVYGVPAGRLYRGHWRDSIPLYVNDRGPEDWFDIGACREWAARFAAHPHGWKAVKMSFGFVPYGATGGPLFTSGRRSVMLRPGDINRVAEGMMNAREALDPAIDMIVHCHNEHSLADALNLARALAPIRPLWIEDLLPVPYSDGWKALKAGSPVPILTGEKLELDREFLPFMANQAVDMMQPDIIFAGGLTGCWKIADLGELFYVPLTTHNIGTVVHCAICAAFGATTRNFVMSENRLGAGPTLDEIIEEKLVVRDSMLTVPTGPGLGVTVNEDALQHCLAPGEPWWG
jgi:L-alanine-DL-glutamate epimerase-like enolase superfamily enzyme